MKKLWFYISFCCNLELLPKVSTAKTQKIMFIGPNDKKLLLNTKNHDLKIEIMIF